MKYIINENQLIYICEEESVSDLGKVALFILNGDKIISFGKNKNPKFFEPVTVYTDEGYPIPNKRKIFIDFTLLDNEGNKQLGSYSVVTGYISPDSKMFIFDSNSKLFPINKDFVKEIKNFEFNVITLVDTAHKLYKENKFYNFLIKYSVDTKYIDKEKIDQYKKRGLDFIVKL